MCIFDQQSVLLVSLHQQKIQVKPTPPKTESERQLKEILVQSKLQGHTPKIANTVGIYPAF